MNDYEERKQARIDRLHEKAEKARAESHSLFKQSTDMASAIPAGQPVHGPADRRYREKIGRKMDQSIAALEKADYYERKAQAAENNTAISSDDPEALAKLKEKLEDLQISQTRMKQINAYYKKNGTSVSGKPVPGTEFTVKDGDGNILGRYVTGKDGTALVTGLVPGSTVVVVETKVPKGYVLDSTPRTITVKNGDRNGVTTGGKKTRYNSAGSAVTDSSPQITEQLISRSSSCADNSPWMASIKGSSITSSSVSCPGSLLAASTRRLSTIFASRSMLSKSSRPFS